LICRRALPEQQHIANGALNEVVGGKSVGEGRRTLHHVERRTDDLAAFWPATSSIQLKSAIQAAATPVSNFNSPISTHNSNYEMLLLAVVSRTLILLKIWLMLWPMMVKTKTAAAPIKTSNNEYSTMSCPCSSLTKFRIVKFLIIEHLLLVRRRACL
jgi:hypothetical protein